MQVRLKRRSPMPASPPPVEQPPIYFESIKAVIEVLRDGPSRPDQIAVRTGLAVDHVHRALDLLEDDGIAIICRDGRWGILA